MNQSQRPIPTPMVHQLNKLGMNISMQNIRFSIVGFFFFSKLITRELQEWHQQQVSKYKTPSNDSPPANNERLASPISHIEDTDDMIASILPLSSEDSRTICSSSFIVSDEPISLPTNIATFLPITSDNSNEQERSRFVDRENEHYSTSIFLISFFGYFISL